MLYGILLVVQIIVCLSMIGLILIQRSEGGALGMGSGPSGVMSARGAGNLLTRMTAILATMFFIVSIALTFVGQSTQKTTSVVDQIGTNNVVLDKKAAAEKAATAAREQSQTSQGASASATPSLTLLPMPNAAISPNASATTQQGTKPNQSTSKSTPTKASAKPTPAISSEETNKHLSDLDARLKGANEPKPTKP